jgi:hypothetical protein
VIGRDQLIRLVGQDREGRNRFAFDVRIIPDAGEHDGLADALRQPWNSVRDACPRDW